MSTRGVLRTFITRVRDTMKAYFATEPFAKASSLSYYTLLSMAPLAVVLIAIGGFVLGREAFRTSLLSEIDALVGHDGAAVLETVLDNAQDKPDQGVLSMVIGVVLLLFGATTVFAELQTTLNRLWGVRAKPRSALTAFVRVRLQSLAILLGTAFLLVASLLLTSSIAALQSSLPGAGALWVAVDTAFSIAALTVVFAMLYKYVPDAQIRWRFTWFGAALTAVLFTIGKLGIGLYLGQASVGSAYGAAGSVVVLMVWVYYAALIFFFGAVATRMIAEWNGAPVEPTEFAEHIRDEPTNRFRDDPREVGRGGGI